MMILALAESGTPGIQFPTQVRAMPRDDVRWGAFATDGLEKGAPKKTIPAPPLAPALEAAQTREAIDFPRAEFAIAQHENGEAGAGPSRKYNM